MQHLNYSRQLAQFCLEKLKSNVLTTKGVKLFSSVLLLHNLSVKFLLPEGGRFNEDPSYSSLDETIPLHLPYPCIALEYHSSDHNFLPGQNETNSFFTPKHVIYAKEEEEDIVVFIGFQFEGSTDWGALPPIMLDKTNYLSRSNTSPDGKVPIVINITDPKIPITDYSDEIGALLNFLNALRCSNVHTERSEPKKAGKHIKAALPFDTYHLLMIDELAQSVTGTPTGGHRSPREHLRRGHIRRLANGRTIWINSTVVAAGRGGGKITKDYALAPT